MGNYLNPGNQGFKESVNSKIYVDKTKLISFTNECLNTEQKFVCVSRPRRFGKSMTLKMLAAYYGNDCDSGTLFESYKIAGEHSFEVHLNKYNVIYINMVDFFDREKTDEMLDYLKAEIMEELYENYEAYLRSRDMELSAALQKIYAQTGKQFIFLIDEWDCVMRIKGILLEQQTRYLDFLRKLLKDKTYVALAYMTGILPIKKYGEHSALNMFDEYSMTNAVPISEFTGFTAEEVKVLCERYNVSYEETRKWYDGYTVDGISLYNPKSVVSAMLRKRFDSYWNFTETYDALKVYICMNMDGLRDNVIRMISGEEVFVDTTSFQNDMTTFKSADDVLTLLIYLGYLTYDFATKKARIPNDEVALEYVKSIKDGGWEYVLIASNSSHQLLIAPVA
ncbi:MAG: AAA family ATPase, partial [Lachnospiraceae bacterium]|nr:AAA family ATPase [Lachnospiraceae bacterium]